MEVEKYGFFQRELRTVNFYTIKSSMGDTKRIKKPDDLYKLSGDEKPMDEKKIEYLSRPLSKEELRIISQF